MYCGRGLLWHTWKAEDCFWELLLFFSWQVPGTEFMLSGLSLLTSPRALKEEHTHTYTYTHARTHTYMHTHTNTHAHAHTCMHMRIRTNREIADLPIINTSSTIIIGHTDRSQENSFKCPSPWLNDILDFHKIEHTLKNRPDPDPSKILSINLKNAHRKHRDGMFLHCRLGYKKQGLKPMAKALSLRT